MNPYRYLRVLFMIAVLTLGVGIAAAQNGEPAAPREVAPRIVDLQTASVSDDGVISVNPPPATTAGARETTVAAPPAADRAADVTGPQQWATLMCKFSDQPIEPHDLAWYQGMYGSTSPGLNHYFAEASFGQFNLDGSNAFGWFTLPNTQSHYTWPDGSLKAGAALFDCAFAADPTVNFSPFEGVQIMVNTNLGNLFAYGEFSATLDGVHSSRMFTAMPLSVYNDIGVPAAAISIANHMHPSRMDDGSFLQADPWNGAGTPTLNNSAVHPDYGRHIQHADMNNRDHLEWVLPARKYTATTTGDHTITLEQTALPGPTNYVMAEIPLFISRDYTRLVIEARRQVGYDVHLPGNAVIIHRDYFIQNQSLGFGASNLITDGTNPGAM